MSEQQQRIAQEILADIPRIKCATFDPVVQAEITPGIRASMDRDRELAEARLQVEKLRLLCGEILACLRVNLVRQTLTTQDDGEFQAMIEKWSDRLI